jgi:type II secretory ATPase GspE/PulE/Tfp pilus assembly ATPase PilB-like protein
VREREADRTTKISRTQRLAITRAQEEGATFVWPAPPYYDFAESVPPQGEECILTFADGEKASGMLKGFLPEYEVLKFQRDKARSAETIGLSALLEVHLVRAVAVRRQAVPESGALFEPSDRQPFSVELANQTKLEGETVGHVQALCGLFLYVPEASGRVIRCFVPAHAARDIQLGKPLGEILVEEKLASSETVTQALERQKQLRARKLGEYLTANQIVSQEQLAAALKQQRAQPMQKLGETLVEMGYLTKAELHQALAIEARDRSVPLGQILADMGVVEAELVHGIMAKKFGVPYVNLRKFRPSAEALKRIPPTLATRYQILPLAETDAGLVVAVDNPTHMERMEEVRFVVGTKLVPVMAPAAEIKQALEAAYGAENRFEAAVQSAETDVGIEQLTMRLSSEGGGDEAGEQQNAPIDSTLVKLVNKVILDAVEQRASDIHIEANAASSNVRVRFRKDGVLVNYLEIPARFRSAVISRLKVMSQLDISERRKPQDGKIPFKRFGPADVELRIATIPTANGLEDVVMRVLAGTAAKPLDDLGFDPEALAAIKRVISRPHGLFLVCGPTGSGKTTTLHSLLGFLNTPELKIWTAEDPIEITQAGLRQVQMNPKIGWTFAAALRSFMRADPDVIMVGEMRDAETARIGIEASLTGHLVLSTLHTNSAAESVVRLLDFGMDRFNFADALLGVLSQRLVRKLCTECRAKHEPSVKEIEELALEYCDGDGSAAEKVVKTWRQAKPTLFKPKGCKACDRTGYQGRMAVYELMLADAAVKRLIQERAPVTDIAAAAVKAGMRTLKQDGIDKVLRGHTDMQQIRAI